MQIGGNVVASLCLFALGCSGAPERQQPPEATQLMRTDAEPPGAN